MPEVEDEIVQEDCDGGHLPDTGKLSFSLGAVFEATDVYEVDPTLDEIELPTPKAPPKAKAPLLTPAQVPAANRDAEETVVFELEELQETPEIVRILPCDDDDRQLDYAGMRVEALARAEARMAFGLFTAADLKYLRKNLKKRPPVGFTLFRDEASQELRSVCRTCLQVCRSPAMSCAATPAMRAEQTETSPTVVSSGPVSVTKQEEDMMMARLLREINETNGAASAAATVISPARSGKPTTRDQVNRQVMRAVMQATFPVKSVDRMNSLMRALHKTLELLFEAGRASSPDAAFVSDLFSATADGTQTPFIEEMRRQHLYEVLEFTAEISTDLIRSAGGESFVNLHGRLDPFTLVTQEETMNVLMGYFPEVKCAAMVHVAWKLGDESSQRVAEVLQKFRHHFLLKHENAWVVVSPKAVVERVVELGPGKLNRDGTDEKVAPQRNRALKVLDNPYDRDERYTPQQLLKETSRVPRKFTEEEEVAEIPKAED
ncbi:Putative ammonium transporter (Fragment) [Durusdinium trenchii]|uniref:Ammonium transporter n=1 Tax=Durusdinium trenchii TaxID=1381693 RepID=A0ABP0QTZ5_9DINO